MADNVTLNATSGGDVIGADDIGGVKYQVVKNAFGANDSITQVSTSDPLPTVQTGALPAGDNNVGNVDIVTMPNVTLAAGTNTNEVVGDVAHDVAISGNPVTVGARASAAAPTDVDADNDAVRLWALRNGALATNITAAGALIPGDATNGLDVDVTRLPALVAGTANIGDVDVLTVPAPLSTTGTGTEATALRVTIATDSTGLISVDDNSGSLTVDAPVGTPVNVQIGNATLTAGITDETTADALSVGGGCAHGAVNNGNPLQLGAEAIAHGTNPTAVDAADRTKLYANRAGVLFVIGGHPNAKTTTIRRADADNGVTDGQLGPTIASGLKIAVTRVSITCSKANTVNVAVKVGFGTANVPADSTSDGAGILVDHDGIAPGSGIVIGNGSGIIGIGADNEELRWTVDDPAGGSVIISVTYFTIES